MRKIAVMTGTRADFGLLRNLIAELDSRQDTQLQLVVTGSHLSTAHGMTVSEVIAAGFSPAAQVPIWGESDSSLEAAIDTGEAIAKFARELSELKPDVVVVLGDRLEAFAMATAATILLIPVAHIHGGELTEGAMDDALRHSITKLSYLHFTTTEGHRHRVERLGEAPDRVFNFGAPVLDALESLNLLSREEVASRFGIRFAEKNLMMTFHPAAFDEAPAQELIDELLAAMGEFADQEGAQLIITGTNNDIGSAEVRAAIAAFAAERPNQVDYVESFGQLGYLSAMKQEGRPMSASVIKPIAKRAEILSALKHAVSPEFLKAIDGVGTPFGKPGFAKKAAEVLATYEIPKPPKKKFWQESH